ncbi:MULTISPECIES: Sec-independent protein translocase subunit TatA [Amycolatopsis]|uniref:Sec-independent protein translocase protein TatA n=3 Tax=Amycolatopsis TaxID=1813 RepID=A0A193BZQ5_AMYOR|nr:MULTISPECIES: Sec-independent protein translocase subunit TatA [Amycolatopsis]RSN21876.1 twin-arginine translocase TatA/TatE family subunit [Streptomyces sp. WAC 05977]ANN17650.1 preprotein translocase subunit TatA [Amycolatopsis orientalis]MBE1577172.1 sec-independent protein translocase protein TatA [Amycolatopsis roodepoortensis]RSN24607.1 twin-arginine translocase TatA/TatE family subunit [Amycolatopsis sp. WAC 04169]UUV32519.1 Sec-independent protein translocase subunit TatA [Amycolato
MNALQPWHIIILVLVVVLLFGAKRLPDAARSIGKSMKIFKAETKDMAGDKDKAAETEEVETKQLPQATTPAPAATAQDKQVADLQRQLDELKKQQAAAPAPAEQAQKNAS